MRDSAGIPLIAFLSERCGGSWNVELPPHHPLEISQDISVDVTDIATIDASSPSVEASAELDPETPGDGAAGKSFVLFGCLIPFLYLLAGVIKIVSEAGSRGVWDATVIAFWWLHVPAGLTFLLVYFLTLSALVRRQHRASKNQTGAAGAKVVDELPSVIFAIVFAATISYFVSMATGPFAPYDRCMKDLSDLGVHYDIRLESCSRYLP